MIRLGLVLAMVLTLAPTGVLALTETSGEWRLDWEQASRGGRPIVRGYVENRHQMRAENVRLRIEQLDPTGRVLTTRTAFVVGTIAYRDHGYFESPVPAADAVYRVSVESFDRAGCGNG